MGSVGAANDLPRPSYGVQFVSACVLSCVIDVLLDSNFFLPIANAKRNTDQNPAMMGQLRTISSVLINAVGNSLTTC